MAADIRTAANRCPPHYWLHETRSPTKIVLYCADCERRCAYRPSKSKAAELRTYLKEVADGR